MARKSDWIIGGALVLSVMLLVFIALLGIVGSWLGNESELSVANGPRIGVLEINGAINSSKNIVDQLARYREDSSIPAIVLRIDSPGGVVAPTQEIFEEIKKTRNAGKIVVASMGSMAASGGYYIACAADSIVANPGTLTGSIGVIFELPNAEGLLKKLGINWSVIKSGEFKDIGSPARELTVAERQLMQALVDDVYGQFVQAVVDSRPLTRDEVLKLADGRVFTGAQAKSLHLVDRLGTYQDSIMLAARMAGITGKPKIVKERRKTIFDMLVDNLDTRTSVPSSLLLKYQIH